MEARTHPASSDVPQLLSAFRANELLRPRFDTPSIVDLATAIFQWAGVDGLAVDERTERIGEMFVGVAKLVFVVVDGLGMNFIDAMHSNSFMPRHLRSELQTVFPSTTSAVFTSIATATRPNHHGIIGWDMYLDEIDAVSTIIRFERRRDGMPLGRLGVGERQAYPIRSLFGEMTGDLVSITPWGIANTPYSNYWTGHKAAASVPYDRMADGVDAAISWSRAASDRSIICLYIPHLDYTAHEHGTRAPETIRVREDIDAEIERLAASLPSNARLVLTADHGQLDGDAHHIRPSDPLVRHLRHEPWGDFREVHFAVEHGREWQFETEFRERFGRFAFLLTANEVEELELLGPGRIEAAARKRLGDYMAISRGPDVFEYHDQHSSARFIGYHSGLAPDEMLVPLIVV